MGGHGTAAQSQTPSHDEHSLRGPLYDHHPPPQELTATSPPMGVNSLRGPLNAHGWEGIEPRPCRARPAGEHNEKEPLGMEVTAVTSAQDIQKK